MAALVSICLSCKREYKRVEDPHRDKDALSHGYCDDCEHEIDRILEEWEESRRNTK